MSAVPASLEAMLAAWNEAEADKVRAHLDEALAENVRFIDPSIALEGIDAFEANVHEVHKRAPGAVYSRTSGVDSHHGLHRYSWAIHRDGALILAGFDVTETDANGRVTQVLGFFGPLPDGAS